METLAYRDDRAEVHQRVLGRLDTNVYVLRCRRSGEAVMIDAADEAELLAGDCRTLGVTRILLTHGHGDHVQAVPGLRAAGYPVLIGPGDTTMVAGHDGTLEHGSAIAVGELSLRVLATPGHTPGSTCLHLEGAPLVFAGDTLFPGGPGAIPSASPPSSPASRPTSSPWRPTRWCCPATACPPPSATRRPTSRSGGPGAGDAGAAGAGPAWCQPWSWPRSAPSGNSALCTLM
jgi:hypothetical protein